MSREYKYKPGKYVENSTKGASMVMPKSYKGDALVQAWLDSRKVGLLSRWLDQDGPNTRFLSDVLRLTVDAAVDALIAEGWELKGIDESRNMLERKYRTNLNPQGRGLKNLMHNRVLDSRRAPVSESKTGFVEETDEEMRRAIEEAMRKAREEKAESVKQMTERAVEAARASGLLYEEGRQKVESEEIGESVVREGMTIEEVNARQEAKDDKLNQALKALAGRPKGDVGA